MSKDIEIKEEAFDEILPEELRQDFESIANYLRDLSERDFSRFIRSVKLQRRADRCREAMTIYAQARY